MLNPDKILLVGDVHGDVRQLARALNHGKATGVDTAVQLGDFGIWPGNSGMRFLKDVNRLLEELEMTLFFVDGNHEDFNQITERPVDESTGLQPWGPRLFRMPRGWRTEWQGLKIAALGGAHSVDRQWRLQNCPELHWEAEHVTEEEAAAFAGSGPVDVIFMHDSPEGAPNSIVDDPRNPGAQFFPQEELYLAALHRQLLATAVNPTSPAFIAHGHYHQLMTGIYRPQGATRDCEVLGLSEGSERFLADYVYILDLVDLKESITSV
jgi:predicted phosphodiesterase